MPQITPWDIGAQFTKMLSDSNLQKQRLEAGLQQDLFSAELARQNATTAYGRQLSINDLDFQQAQQLARQREDFMHEENKLINLDYKQATRGRGRAGYVTGPAAQPGMAQPQGGGGGGAMTPQGAYAHLIKIGAPPMVAAGIVGNIDAESGWDPAVFSGTRRGDNGTAFGAGQWRGSRQQHLYEYAQSKGHPQPTPEDQVEFYLVEAQSGRDPGATKAVQLAAQAQSPEEAAAYIMHHYERPADDSSMAQRQSAARSIFDTGSGQQSLPPDPAAQTSPSAAPAIETSQRRLYSSSPDPTPATPSTVTGTPDATLSTADQEFYKPARAWGVEDFVANGINARDLYGIPSDMDVVDTQFYSGAAIDLMDEEQKALLVPVGGYDPQETNQYLVLQPKPGAAKRDEWGHPIEGNQPNEIGAPPVPAPTATAPPTGGAQAAPLPSAGITAPPVPIPTTGPVSVPAPQAPASPVSTAPAGQRTRRAPDGTLEFLVDGQWRPSGG